MNSLERLRQVIAEQHVRLRLDVPVDRDAAVLALVRALDRLPNSPCLKATPDLVTGHRLASLGGNRALQLCLAQASHQQGGRSATDDDWDRWAERFLHQCSQLCEAELVLGHCESG